MMCFAGYNDELEAYAMKQSGRSDVYAALEVDNVDSLGAAYLCQE